MFENLAKFPLLRARRPARQPQQAVPANDNQPDLGRPNRRPVLVCHWTFDQGQGLTSHWDIQAAPEPKPPLAEESAPDPAFTQLSSYCRTTGKLRAGPNGGPKQGSAAKLLQARH
jgi:hypothetical protein